MIFNWLLTLDLFRVLDNVDNLKTTIRCRKTVNGLIGFYARQIARQPLPISPQHFVWKIAGGRWHVGKNAYQELEGLIRSSIHVCAKVSGTLILRGEEGLVLARGRIVLEKKP